MAKTKTIAWSCASALIGLLIGTFVISPTVGGDSLSGNIGKILKHKSDKAVNAKDLALIESKLKADSTYLTQTSYSLAFMSSRISEFKDYAAVTADIVADIPQLQSYAQPMKDLGAFATNAQDVANSALASLGRLTAPEDAAGDTADAATGSGAAASAAGAGASAAGSASGAGAGAASASGSASGSSAPASASAPGASASWSANPDASFEELSNNAVLAYMMLEKGLATTRNFVSDVDAFLKGKNTDQYQTLAYIRDAWVSFNLVDAVLNEDKTSISFWDKAGFALSAKESLSAMTKVLNECPACNSFFNTAANAAFFNAGVIQQSLGSSSERLRGIFAESLGRMSTNFYGSSLILGPAEGTRMGLSDAASLNQNDAARLGQNDAASLNQNDAASLNQNDAASLNQNDAARLGQNDAASLNLNNAASMLQRAAILGNNIATLNLNDPAIMNSLSCAAAVLNRDGSISTLSYVHMNTDNTSLQNAQSTSLQNAQSSSLQLAQNPSLQNAQSSSLQNAQSSSLQLAQNPSLQNAQVASLQNAQNILQNVQTELQNTQSTLQNAQSRILGIFATSNQGVLGVIRHSNLPGTQLQSTSLMQSKENAWGSQMKIQAFNLNALSKVASLNIAMQIQAFNNKEVLSFGVPTPQGRDSGPRQ